MALDARIGIAVVAIGGFGLLGSAVHGMAAVDAKLASEVREQRGAPAAPSQVSEQRERDGRCRLTTVSSRRS
jgi:hypothetical protein